MMHICVIGTGAAGWMAVRELQNLSCVKSITVIGSPAVPTVGVGESTTRPFFNLISSWFPRDDDYYRFLCDIDAAVKYGVYYQGWGGQTFLHAFVGEKTNQHHGYALGGLGSDEDSNHYLMANYDRIVSRHEFCSDPDTQSYTWHIDANRFIVAMEKMCCANPITTHLRDTVVKANFDHDRVTSVRLESGHTISADYFVSAVGQTAFNQQIFRETYEDYGHVLLTDRALFFPLSYTDQSKQFHPYTVARAMPHGWRWITPTWSRIGTGYAFSSRHVSTEQAIQDFRDDVGITDIEPFQVDFHPRRIQEVYKPNHCSIGLASGFLEPLDAPGLSFTVMYIESLCDLLEDRAAGKVVNLTRLNQRCRRIFDDWAAFILWQYRCAVAREGDFWRDHSSIRFDHLESIIDLLFKPNFNPYTLDLRPKKISQDDLEPWMFYHTAAGRGQRWPLTFYPQISKHVPDPDAEWHSHYDWFRRMHYHYGAS